MLQETMYVRTIIQNKQAEKIHLKESLANLLYQIDSLRLTHAPSEEIMDLIILFSETLHKYDKLSTLPDEE